MSARTDTEIRNLETIALAELGPLLPFGLSIRCPAHPAYRGIRKPQVDCTPCDTLYATWEYARERGWR